MFGTSSRLNDGGDEGDKLGGGGRAGASGDGAGCDGESGASGGDGAVGGRGISVEVESGPEGGGTKGKLAEVMMLCLGSGESCASEGVMPLSLGGGGGGEGGDSSRLGRGGRGGATSSSEPSSGGGGRGGGKGREGIKPIPSASSCGGGGREGGLSLLQEVMCAVVCETDDNKYVSDSSEVSLGVSLYILLF